MSTTLTNQLMAKTKDQQKVELIILFLTENKDQLTKCSDAHKTYQKLHGTVSYVHFNRKFRELLPHLELQKKVRTLRPKLEAPPLPPKNKELKELKRAAQYFHRTLYDTTRLLEKVIEENVDKEAIIFYRDLRDRDRAAMIETYQDLLEYYESKISDDIKEVEKELETENVRKNIELDKLFSKPTNVLVGDDNEDGAFEEIPDMLKTAAEIIKNTDSEEKVHMEGVPKDLVEELHS